MKKLYKFIIFISSIGIFNSTYSMRRTTTKIATPASAEIKEKILPKIIKKSFQSSSKELKDKVYKIYSDVFYHPLYTHWFEPLYVGNKAEHWGNQILNVTKTSKKAYTDYSTQRAHNQFYKIIYQSWKDRLTPEELLQHHDVINAYESAYNNYYNNSKNLDNHKELVHQTERIYQKIHDHPTSIPKNDESVDYSFTD